MSENRARPRRDLITDDEIDVDDGFLRRQRVDPDERDEYEEWRQERCRRGRKRKDKAGRRHPRRRDDLES